MSTESNTWMPQPLRLGQRPEDRLYGLITAEEFRARVEAEPEKYPALPETRARMGMKDRRFYRGRVLSELAARLLITSSVDNPLSRGGLKAARRAPVPPESVGRPRL